MNNQNSQLIGGAWLCERYNLSLVNPQAVTSSIGARRQSIITAHETREVYQETMRPPPSSRGHLTFHLKHEPIHLEMLSRLFQVMDAQELADWANDEPSGQYAKRAGFLYEWLTLNTLPIGEMNGNNVDALNSDTVAVAKVSTLNRRWKVRDNMPGTRSFCPVVRLTDDVRQAINFDCAAQLNKLQIEYGDDTLLKSAVWLTLRESRSSFQMEGEADKTKRIERFAEAIHRYTGTGELLLSQDGLSMLQQSILGQETSLVMTGLRKSPVFVGQTIRYENIIHYIAPPHEHVPNMLAGLKRFLEVTESAPTTERA